MYASSVSQQTALERCVYIPRRAFLFLSCYHKHFPLYLCQPINSDFFKIHCYVLFSLYVLIALHMATLKKKISLIRCQLNE